LWSDADYVQQEVPKILQPIVELLLEWMKKCDYKGAQRVTHFIANSKEVRARIRKYYNRDNIVIYPFIDTEFWKSACSKKDYFLVVGRLQAHKKNELIVEIFNELNIPLHVVGAGRQESYLRSIAKNNINFLGRISDEQLRDEYSGALGVVFPQIEDFGLVPLEAAACGTATLGLAKGGSLETIIPGVTGELFENYNKEIIRQQILSWNPQKYKTDELRRHAEKFSEEVFEKQLKEFIGSTYENRN
jgi:glycosyltransferase involved in cell wall biosynthesis